jgi:hypothetical protein
MGRAECPVGLLVKHGTSSFLRRDTEYTPFTKPAPAVLEQRIHVTMTNLSAQEIVKAQITVHGFSDKWRAIPLAGAAPDLTRTVNLVLDVRGNDRASSDLSLRRFTSVASVDVNSLTYADGSAWQASVPGACSVTPERIMLLSAAR